MTAAPPQDTLLDTFEERQRRWMQEDRLGRSMALETLHKFQANDKEVVYLGTPERTKTRRSDQGPITPDATASVYHSPHHLVVVVHPDGGNPTADCQSSMFRTYSYHHEGLSPSSSSSHQASPETSYIPMSSLMKVARTLLEGEEHTVPENSSITTAHYHNLLPLINHQEAPIVPATTTIFESSELRNADRTNSSRGAEQHPSIGTFREPVLGDDIEVEPTKSPPTTQKDFALVQVGDTNEESNVIPKASSYELKSFASFGTAILPEKPTKSYDDAERRMVRRSQEDTLDDSMLMSTTADRDESSSHPPSLSRPPARKVSEGSHSDVATEVHALQNSQSGEDGERIVTAGSVEDALQSFASFGVAILPTVSCSRDDEEEEASSKSSLTMRSSHPCTRPTVNVQDIGLLELQPTQDSEGDVCCCDDDNNDDDNDMTQQPASIFRPLISPSIQNRVDELSSKATCLGPVARPLTTSRCTPPMCSCNEEEERVEGQMQSDHMTEVTGNEDQDGAVEGTCRGETEDIDPEQEAHETEAPLLIATGGVQEQHTEESSSSYRRRPTATTAAALPTSTFLGFTWSSSIMPAAW